MEGEVEIAGDIRGGRLDWGCVALEGINVIHGLNVGKVRVEVNIGEVEIAHMRATAAEGSNSAGDLGGDFNVSEIASEGFAEDPTKAASLLGAKVKKTKVRVPKQKFQIIGRNLITMNFLDKCSIMLVNYVFKNAKFEVLGFGVLSQ